MLFLVVLEEVEEILEVTDEVLTELVADVVLLELVITLVLLEEIDVVVLLVELELDTGVEAFHP